MNFEEWHRTQLNGDADTCPHERWERLAWEAGWEAGRESMRDEAVKVCETPLDEIQTSGARSEVVYRDNTDCAQAIKEIP